MYRRAIKREYKINVFVVLVILICLIMASFFINNFVSQRIVQEVIKNLKNVAHIVAYDTKINDALKGEYSTEEVGTIAQKITDYADGVEFIIVIDMDGNIYSHPQKEFLGRIYKGEAGEKPYLDKEHYFSSKGTMGNTVKYFMPVINGDQQIGVVISGTYVNDINKLLTNIDRVITISIVFGLIAGTFVAIGLFGVEPREVTELLKERSAILFAIKDGIVAVNNEGMITTINDEAKKMLGLSDEELNKPIDEVLPNINLESVLHTGEAEYDTEYITGGSIFITNRIPVIVSDQIVGAVATFKDKTEITMLAKELTGVKSMVDSLRAYSHEYMNKLHVILGLIQLENYDEAQKYILQVTKQQQQILTFVMKNIKDPTTAGLLIGKFSRSREMGVELILDDSSNLGNLTGVLNEEFMVIVLGNLIDNALEATEIKECGEEKKVRVFLEETRDNIIINVSDTGVGIEKADINRIFIRGFSTKQRSRGIGMSIVKRTIEAAEGEIKILSDLGKGSKFIVTVPKKVRV